MSLRHVNNVSQKFWLTTWFLFKKIAIFLASCLTILGLYLSLLMSAVAATWVIPTQGDVVGEVQYTEAQAGETLSDVGLRFDMGYHEMVQANPRLDALHVLPSRTNVVIPSQYILPPGPRRGIVINLAEFRLYYYPPGDNVVITMPVGIGRKGWSTPLGITKIIGKERNPAWRPTAKLKAEAALHGVSIPDEFPAGANNPLGKHVLRLGWPTYLIHGSNRRDGIGSRVSAGCIRLLPDDIDYLFDYVALGTRVRIIKQPVKLGRVKDSVFIELHSVLAKQDHLKLQRQVANRLVGHKNLQIDDKALNRAILSSLGIPIKIASY